MKTPKRLRAIVLGSGLLALSTVAMAQDNTEHTTTRTDANGNQLVVKSGQPVDKNYGPAPSFEQLDANHDGWISRDEANAYLPLFNDFDHVAFHANRVSRQQFERWNSTENR